VEGLRLLFLGNSTVQMLLGAGGTAERYWTEESRQHNELERKVKLGFRE
jgi:hypothetical protein